MKCQKCQAKTKVIQTMGTRRRRKCPTCGHLFATEERIVESRPAGRVRQNSSTPQPKKEDTIRPSAIRKQVKARRRLEALRDLSFLDDDFDYIPEKW